MISQFLPHVDSIFQHFLHNDRSTRRLQNFFSHGKRTMLFIQVVPAHILMQMEAVEHDHMCAATTIASNSKPYRCCLAVATSHRSLQNSEQIPIYRFHICRTLGRNFCFTQCTERPRFHFSLRVQSPLESQTKLATIFSCLRLRKTIRWLGPFLHQVFPWNSRSSCPQL